MADRVERLTNLLALLLETNQPLSLVQIAGELSGQYPEADQARRATFERDKAALRDIGVPIETEIVAGGPYAGQTVYRIDRRAYELADLDLAHDEMRALQIAVAAVRTGSRPPARRPSGSSAVRSATSARRSRQSSPIVRSCRSSARPLPSGRRSASPIGANHRRLDPWGLLLRGGFWYVIGHDHDRDEQRTFRVDRFDPSPDGITVGESGSYERPPSFDPRSAFPADPKEIGHDAFDGVQALVRVDHVRAAAVERELGEERVVDASMTGASWCRVPASNLPAFRSWVLGLLDHAVVLGPPRSASDIVAWLASVASATRRRHEWPTQRRGPAAAAAGDAAVADGGRRGPVAEVARRYDLTEAQVQKDLELVAMCGLPPFVDEMIDVFVDDGMVFVGVPRLFTRPLRLTAPEGFTLLAAGRAAMELPGADPDGPLGRGLDKLARGARGGRARGRHRRHRRRRDRSRPAGASPTTWPRRRRRDGNCRSATTRRHVTRSATGPSCRATCSSTRATGTCWPTTIGRASAARSASTASNRPSRPALVVGADDAVDGTGPVLRRRRRAPTSVRLGPSARWVVEEYPVDDVKERRIRRLGRGAAAGVQRAVAGQAADPARPERRVVEPAGCDSWHGELARGVLAGYSDT